LVRAAAQETHKSTSGSMQEQNGGMSSHSTKQPSGQAPQTEEKGGKQIERLVARALR
jgi:hypothetical protein